MPLEKKPPKQPRSKRPRPLSFRFTVEVARHLELLAVVLNRSKIEILEELIESEYRQACKRYTKDFQKLEAQEKKVKASQPSSAARTQKAKL